MLANKKFNLVLSFLLAFALWFYVVGQMNPTTKKTYRYVPIMLTNEQTLNDNGLAVLKVSDDTLRVTVSAKRDVMSKLSSADIVATVDLTDAAEGKNKLPIDMKIPENVEIDNQSINDVEITVEERVTKTKDVVVEYTGTYPENEEPATVKVDPETVQVSGAKSLVDKVSHVRAEIKAADVADELSSFTTNLTAVTSGGSEVQNISLSSGKCKVTAILYKTKKVKVVVPIKDNSSDNYTRSTSYPKTILIKGPSDVLSAVKEISSEELDITGITENQKLEVLPVLPAGTQLAGKNKVITVTLKVSKAKKKKVAATREVKSFTFTEDDIEIVNDVAGAYSADRESLEVQVYGTKEQLALITSSAIRIYVDAEGQEADKISLPVKAECSEAHSAIDVIPSTITLTRE